MEREWYLYLSNHHRGPFSTTEVISFLSMGKLKPQTPAWKEGYHNWVGLHEIPDFQKKKSLLSGKRKAPPPSAVSNPPANPEASLSSVPVKLNFSKRSSQKTHFTLKALNIHLKAVFFPVLVVSLAFLSLVMQKTWNFTGTPDFERPANMKIEDYNRLKAALAKDPQRETTMELALSQDQSTLWMASNLEVRTDVGIKFTSISGKVLSQEDIVFFAYGKFKDHLVAIKEFHLEKGTKIALGHYEVEVGPLGRMDWGRAKYIGEDHLMGKNPWEKKSTFYFGRMAPKEFEGKLASYNAKIGQAQAYHYKELVEKYHTLFSLITQMGEMFLSDTSTFAQKYAGEIGVVLRDITMDNHRIHQNLGPEQKTLIEEYGMVTGYGKQIGVLAMSIIEEINKPGNFQGENKTRLIGKFVGEMEIMKKSFEFKIEDFQNKLKFLPSENSSGHLDA